jgi:non-ribosomal peptide synthetase component F
VRFFPCEQLLEGVETQITPLQAVTNEFAYILFTSGSTGAPKGVPISHQNLVTYVDYMTDALQLNADDKVSQIFDPTFDLSMHDMFVTWLSGACLYVVPDNQLLAPGKFIKQHQLTVWFSVPSTVAIMAKLGMTKADAYDSIRYSLFCGEPLPVSLAKQWQLAARNSRLINLYGPTEATIACSAHEFNVNHDYQSAYLPIGKAFPHMSFSQSESGELVINGPQVFAGYLNNPCKTKETLKLINGALSYFSGDIVAQQQNGEFTYLSRKDDQIKIQGFRVELSEIDTLAQTFLNNPLVQSVATPKHMPQTITVFICDAADKEVEQSLMNCLKHKLPTYMLPKKVIWLDSMPLNSNGKIDKLALHSMQEKQ